MDRCDDTARGGGRGRRGGRRGAAAGAMGLVALLAVAAAPPPAAARAPAVAQEPAAAGAPDGAPAPDTSRAALLRQWARSYFPGRSGDVMMVPEPGVIITGARGPAFMHGSPWDYDAAVPLLAYGPGVPAGEFPGAVGHEDVGATLAALLGLPALPTTVGTPLPPLAPGWGGEGTTGGADAADAGRASGSPGIVALLVLDGFRSDFFEMYADSLPVLRRLRADGARFPEARVLTLPSATSVAHAGMATGTTPSVHGVTGNTVFDRVSGDLVVTLGGASPGGLFALTVADRWTEATSGRAVVYAQGGTDYPAAALGGHGACLFGGRPGWVAYFESTGGTWATNEDCYRLPEALADRSIAALVDSVDGTWLGHALAGPSSARATPLFTRFEGEAAVEALESLDFGADTLADLYLVNLKTTDYVGHAFGPTSPEMRATVGEVDRQVGRIVEALGRRAGDRGFVLLLTSDHGMPAEPRDAGGRVAYEDLIADVQARFDPGGPPLVRALDGADNQLYLDRERLRELGLAPADVAEFVQALPYVRAAFPAAEVAAAAADPDGAGRPAAP